MVYLSGLDSILKYVSWEYFFLILLLGGIIGGLFALIRGIYRTTCKYIVEGILIIVLVLCMPGIVNWLSSIDLSSFFNFSFTIDNSTISLTSVDQTVVDVLVAKGINSTSDPSLYFATISLVHSVLGLAMYIVGMILIMLITPVLTWLVYLLTFMIFISKERRKNKKHRFIASIEGFVCGIVIACLFIAPFSSLVNIASQASSEIKNSSSDQVSDSDFNTLIDFLSKYQDSAFYTSLSFGSKDSSKALDTRIMTQVSEVTINGTKTSIYNEIGEIIKIFSSCGDSLKIDVSDQGKVSISLDANTLLNPDTISSLLDNLSSWETFIYLVPALAQMGNNIDQIEKIDLDLSKISWGDTVSNINQIYSALYNTGLIDFYVVPLVKGDTMPNYFVIDISKKDNYKEAINKILDNEIIANNLPYILYNASKNDQYSYLSSSLDTYKNINYKNVFSNLVDFLFYTCNTLNEKELYFDNVNQFTSNLLEKVKDENNDEIVKALLAGGKLTITNSDSSTSEVEYDGLLSNELFSNDIIDFPKFFKSTLSSVEGVSKYLTQDDLLTIGEQIKENGLKTEVKNIVNMLSDLFKLVDNIQEKGSIDFGDEETRNQISNVLIKSKNSSIVSKILPKVIKRMLSENAESLEKNLYGLKVTDFDFEPVDDKGESIFIDQCNDLINIAKYAQDLSKQIEGKEDTSSMLKSIDTDTLRNLLTGVINNKIINPAINITGIKDDYEQNYNFNKIIKGIFKQDSLKDIGFIVNDDLSSIEWLGIDGEIENIINIIQFCKDNTDLFEDDLTLDSVNPDQIQEMIELISTSKLLGGSINSILTKKVSPMLKGIGASINFYAVKDWKAEASKFAAVLRKLQELPSTDFSQVDWFSLDENQINSLLTNLYQLDLFKVSQGDSSLYEDQFGNLVYKLLLNNDSISDIFGTTSLSKEDFSIVEDKLTGQVKTDFSSWTGTLVETGEYSYANKKGEVVVATNQMIDSNGEIYKLSHLFGLMKESNFSSSEFDYKKDLTKENLKELLKTITSSSCIHKVVPNVLNYFFDKMGDLEINSTTKISMSLFNTEILNELSEDDLNNEINYFVDIYGMVLDDVFSSLKDAFKEDSSKLEIDQDNISKIENLLNDFAKMKMSTTLKVGESMKFIDQLMSNILNISSIDQSLTGASNKEDAKILMFPYIKQITSSSEYKWDFDIDSSLNSEQRMQAVYENTTSQILSITKILRYASQNQLNLNGIKGDIGSGEDSISADALKQMLTYINQSKLMHFGIGNLFNNVFKTINFDAYLNTGEGGKTLTIDTYTHLDYSENNISYWQQNIDNFILLYSNISSKSDGTNSLDKISIGKGEGQVSIYDLIKPLKNMPLFDNKREYVVYNLLDKMSSSNSSFSPRNYIRPISSDTTSATVSAKALKVRNLLFNDSYTDSQLKTQCDILDNIIDISSSMSTADLSGENSSKDATKTLANNIFNLVLSTYDYEENGTYKGEKTIIGYFASEMISNILVERLAAVDKDSKTFFEELFFTSDLYGRDYRYLNIIEANGLKGLILLSSFDKKYFEDSDNKENDYPEFKAAFSLLGRKLNSTYVGSDDYYGKLSDSQIALLKAYEADTTLTKYYAKTVKSNKLNNSRLAIQLFNTYASKIVVYENTMFGQTTKFTLSDIVTNVGVDFEDMSFEEASDAIVAALKALS